jgi:hypothetical protein
MESEKKFARLLTIIKKTTILDFIAALMLPSLMEVLMKNQSAIKGLLAHLN